ncbi:zinc-binding dehydrogenase [Amorphus orientalis]|uniref:NADPH:quinone reductase-like Zn-dependent oxidoreductase n=1 Tax=Amorphus orientalis TaxID=649198 RepID=A0AAE4AQ47_9HYPH|nr:zinc-binding dehydrogenase [Amorphus orientalis]MDQ0313631.1 NADPH:quinone reductase-like Zn-dependent oxidoreductase [Amorphus orientalis]
MVSIVESTVIEAPIEAVWRVLRDFNSHVHWHPAIAASEIEGGLAPDAVGAVRRFHLADGAMLREQLIDLDDRARELTYCLIEGPLPLFDYVASIRLRPVTDTGSTFWEWRSTFRPPPGERDALTALVRDQIYRAGFRALGPYLGAGARPSHPVAPRPAAPASEPQPSRPVERPAPAPSVQSGPDNETQAIVVDRYGGPEELVPRLVPVAPPGPGEVQIRHAVVGVNFIDIYCRTGFFDLLQPPGVPGMEAVGRIVAVGDGVHSVRPGDRVGYACPPVGAYCALRTMAPDLMVRLPDALDDETAAAGLLKGVTASFLLHEVHPVRRGEVVVVHAASGGVGTLLTQWAVALGARVVATVSTEAKAGIPRAAGAERVVVREREDFVTAVREVSGGRGADVVFDAIGRDSFQASVDALAVTGHLVSFGQASGPIGDWDIGSFASKSARISRPNYGHYTDTAEKMSRHASRFFAALEAGILRVAPPTRYFLDDAAGAHRDLESGRTTGSIVLIPD